MTKEVDGRGVGVVLRAERFSARSSVLLVVSRCRRVFCFLFLFCVVCRNSRNTKLFAAEQGGSAEPHDLIILRLTAQTSCENQFFKKPLT